MMPGILRSMNWSGAEIPEDVVTLQALVRQQLAERDARIAHRDDTIERLQEHINVLLAKRYGASGGDDWISIVTALQEKRSMHGAMDESFSELP